MKVIQMTLDEDLIKEVDKTVKKLGTTRSAFTRQALKESLVHLKQLELEEKHKKGYLKKPIKKDEFNDWENEQVWIN